MKIVLSIALALLSGLFSGMWERAALAADKVDIREWTVPWEKTRPRDPYVRTEGQVWFVGQRGDYLARLDASSGEFTRFDLEPGVGPHTLLVDKKDQVWFAGNKKGYIGKLDPKTGTIKKYSMPDPAAKDPHTMAFDGEGDIWFSVQHGNFIGKILTASGEIHLIPVPTPQARPYGLVTDSQGRPWVALLGTNNIATADGETQGRPRETVQNLNAAQLIRYALSLADVTGAVIGIESLELLEQNLDTLRRFQPMNAAEVRRIRAALSPFFRHKGLDWMDPDYQDGLWS